MVVVVDDGEHEAANEGIRKEEKKETGRARPRWGAKREFGMTGPENTTSRMVVVYCGPRVSNACALLGYCGVNGTKKGCCAVLLGSSVVVPPQQPRYMYRQTVQDARCRSLLG